MKIAIYTLGCKVNQYESASLLEIFERQGHEIVDISHADLFIVNTCTVTHKAAYECRRLIRKFIKRKPNAICAVAGCYPQIAKEEILNIKGIDYLIGHSEKAILPEILPYFKKQSKTKVIIGDPSSYYTLTFFPPPRHPQRTRAYLKIQDGCNAFCSYCIIPYARGRSRSLPLDLVLKRLCCIAQSDFREVVLTGINLGAYGKDLKPPIDLPYLLNTVEEKDLPLRIRLGSLNPLEIGPDLIDLFTSWPNLCPHLHISLQSGSNEILKKMNRPYSIGFFKKLATELTDKVPQLAIGADIITGFPGESEKDFKETYRLSEALPIAYFHIFPFSARAGTKADQMKDKIPHEEVKRRTHLLRKLDTIKRRAFYYHNFNKIVHVLVEKRNKNGYLKGYSENYLPVCIKGKDELRNRIVKVKLLELRNKAVYGKIVI